jgi:dephospho-CoA kinase
MNEFNGSQPRTDARNLGDVCWQMQPKKRVIAISGMPGSGKGLAAEAAKQLGLEVLVLGDVIREETERRGLEPTPKNVGKVMLQLRADEGPASVAKRLLPKVEAIQSSVVVVEGIRSLSELTELKSRFEVVTVAVQSSPKTRFERLLSRNRSDDPKTWDVFHERDIRELEVGLGDVIALADILVINEGTMSELQSKFKDLISKLNRQ